MHTNIFIYRQSSFLYIAAELRNWYGVILDRIVHILLLLCVYIYAVLH